MLLIIINCSSNNKSANSFSRIRAWLNALITATTTTTIATAKTQTPTLLPKKRRVMILRLLYHPHRRTPKMRSLKSRKRVKRKSSSNCNNYEKIPHHHRFSAVGAVWSLANVVLEHARLAKQQLFVPWRKRWSHGSIQTVLERSTLFFRLMNHSSCQANLLSCLNRAFWLTDSIFSHSSGTSWMSWSTRNASTSTSWSWSST